MPTSICLPTTQVLSNIFAESKNSLVRYRDKCWKVYKKHSDLISSSALLILNTILLASQIFQQIPAIVPRVSLVLLNYTGIIWLNVQVRSFIKSCQDLGFAIQYHDVEGIVFTASKVLVKALNILLTGSMFIASVVSLAGYPGIALGMYTAMRNPAMAGWVASIFNDIADYYQNKKLLKNLSEIDQSQDADIRIQLIVRNFIQMTHPKSRRLLPSIPENLKKIDATEKRTSMRIVRQSGEYLLYTFKETLAAGKCFSNVDGTLSGLDRNYTYKFYLGLQDGIKRKQDLTRANLGLIVLGYASLGLCRMYPNTIIQYGVTWGMSMLYTGKLLYQKYHQRKLQHQIS